MGGDLAEQHGLPEPVQPERQGYIFTPRNTSTAL